MRARRTLAILTVALVCALPQFGCNSQDGGVDAPLNTTAGPPPPRPNKPDIHPNGSGGQTPGGGTASGGAATGAAKGGSAK